MVSLKCHLPRITFYHNSKILNASQITQFDTRTIYVLRTVNN